MTLRRLAGASAVALSLVLATAGCQPSGPTRLVTDPPPATHLTIYAAASLGPALDELVTAYEAATPGVSVTLSTGSSAALRTQIEKGAPADVFLSADTTNPQRLVDGGLAAGPATTFASNGLAIIVPAGNPAGITSFADLARPGLAIIAAGDQVPITSYATELVTHLADLPDAPPGFAAAYATNVASKEEDVQAVVAKIALGEGDAAIVYATDATASPDVRTIAIPEGSNVAATYAGVVLTGSSSGDAARHFLDWLRSDAGQAILARFGFLPPP